MLEVRNVSAGYGAINVLWDVSLQARTGELTTIVGVNGAGKTTLLRTIMGLIPQASGVITLDGRDVSQATTWDLAASGVALVPEGRMIFRDMSVEDNLFIGAYPKQCRGELRTNLEHVYSQFPILKERRRQMAGTLSGGQAQMLAIGRSLMSDPSVLLLDEPSLGLAPVLVREVFDTLQRIKEDGRTILLVEQNTHMALSVADHVYLMQSGRITFTRPASEVSVEQLHDLYFAR